MLAVPNGTTIAYSAFMTEVLEHSTDLGFPPFGSLLLCLIATNADGERALNNVYALMDMKLGDSNSTREPLKSAIAFLKMLSQLPEKYRTERNRLLLLHTLFEGSKTLLSRQTSKHILREFKLVDKKPGLLFAALPSALYQEEFCTISELAARFPDTKTIINRLAHLPLVEEEILWEKPAPAQTGKNDFIQELIDHSQTFHVGSLIKSLWGSLQIPHHHHVPSQQPMGGISDLTNRGGLDRLLLSEFANEEILFLSRLANGEALYINREMPPQHNRLERVILIDVSMRSWGTPKIIAYALLLAIARHPKTNIPCSAFTVGNDCHPLSFYSTDEVIASMHLLEPCLHPAQGLEAFFKTAGAVKDKEVILIAAKDVFEQPQLQKIVSDYGPALNYLIQTDAAGNIDVYRKQQKSRKHIQHILLDLEGQWKKEPERSPAQGGKDKKTNQEYPILFPAASNPKNILLADEALFVITAEGALIRSVNRQSIHAKGWEMIYENLPLANGEAEMGVMQNGDYVLLQFNTTDKKLVITNLKTGEEKITYFQEWQPSLRKQFVFYNDLFIYYCNDRPGRYWPIEFDKDIVIRSYGTPVPDKIFSRFEFQEKELRKLQYKKWDKSVLKNVADVFINQVNNLVFNNVHELRLTDHSIIKFEKTNFKSRLFVAAATGKEEFCFADGSVIEINRSGMLILKSSNPVVGTIYVPSVLDSDLGVASEQDIAGNYYYYPERTAKKDPVSRVQFWKRYMEPFINTIIRHGTSDKTPY